MGPTQPTEGMGIAKGFTTEGAPASNLQSRFTCSLAHPEAPGTSDKQVPEEGGVLPLPDPGFLRGICTAETTFLQQRSSGGVQGRTSQLCPAWGGSGDPDVELGSFSKLEKVINEVWPLPAPYVLF